jgi:hypothetical protein
VIDVSRSMGREPEGRRRPIETARDLAARTFQSMRPADRTAVLLAGAQTRVLAPWTTDAAPYLAAVESVEALPVATSLDAALETLGALIDQGRPGAAVELCFFTDNTSGSWTPGAISSFVAGLPKEKPVLLRLIDVGFPGARNGWLASARLRESDAGPVLHVEASCLGEAPQTRTLYVSGLSGVKELTKTLTLQPGRATNIDLALPATFDRAGSRARLRLDPPDELPDDDEFFVDLDTAGAALVLLVEPEADSDTLRPGFPLRSALQALEEAGFPSADYQLSVRSPAALTAGDFATADVVLLADVPGLTAAQSEALTKRIQKGAGAAVFLGPGVQMDVYNLRFIDRLHPAEGLLPAPLGSIVQVPATRGGVAPWGHWNERHPLLAGLLDPQLGDLAHTQSQAYLKFTAVVPQGDDALAQFEDGTPALIARRVGAGRVVWFNASARDPWCDLSRRKSFVPLVDRLLSYLSVSGWRRSYACAEPVALRLSDNPEGSAVVATPSGTVLHPRVEVTSAGTLLKLEGLMEPGFYSVFTQPGAGAGPSANETRATGDRAAPDRLSAQPLTFVVQPGRFESALEPIDLETLRAWWLPAKFELVKPATFARALAFTDDRMIFEPGLLLLAALVFLAEMFFVHWLCPRIDPALAVSPARRRGFVAPLRNREGPP